MKRIVLLVMAMLVIMSGVSFGQGYIHRDYRWIPGKGFIHRDYRWSTMFGGYIHRDYRWSLLASRNKPCAWEVSPVSVQPAKSVKEQKRDYRERIQTRGQRIEGQKADKAKIRILKPNDGMEIIRNYLKAKGIMDDFNMDQFLCIGNKTVSVNFVFKHRNIIIKYWNPKEIASLTSYRRDFYEIYKTRYVEFSKKYPGKIYAIVSADKQDIENKLEHILSSCF